ncbi:hypothetical protein L21SP3_00861 [Sedimentisphaera cyanobacteriorum]|uniref:EF-hand domain-containing protein n=1 Tax=Sedimentisphaera cyanobacteriorum TaxID=1940790 RepID=A0A1Q2HPA1_9BACT|nr:dockerin type I domain-containing protein [Sedimentisphaera cyanobacteriorum]AQQ09063.1 hypothetical protein L21SP3_00861 [Sedimentisphaera cyanobacteriorum]
MKFKKILLSVSLFLLTFSAASAECPLDHIIIGVNEDGIADTEDDNRLFADCRQKYRSSTGWYYLLTESIFPSYKWRIGEPGFDQFQQTNPDAGYTYDPQRALNGSPDEDYKISIECISISTGLRVVHKNYPSFTISQAEQSFSHSEIHELRNDPHMHLSFQAVDQTGLYWVTWKMTDSEGKYESSEPFTLVFNAEPLLGDLAVDSKVDLLDLLELSAVWLRNQASSVNDFYERADTNRDGAVNMEDFANLAVNWQEEF